LIPFCWALEIRPMKGELRVMKEALFYGFSLERHFPDNHLLRKIDPRPAIGGHCQALLCMDYVLAASEAFLARAQGRPHPRLLEFASAALRRRSHRATGHPLRAQTEL
jgi:hypothetical protein